MIARAVEALGADYSQWRVLTRMMLKSDLRSASAMQVGGAETKRGAGVPWKTFILYGIYGVAVGILAAVLPGAFLSGTVALLMVSLVVAFAIVVDFQSVVISPDDYEILAYQPVSSRTYFVVKLTNVLLYTGIIGALVGGLATVPFLWRFGPLVAAGWLSALAGTVFWTALVILYLYTAMLHLVSPQRLRRVVSYVQFLMPMALFFPFVLSEADWFPTIANDPPAQFLLLPPTWFASLLPLAEGDWSGTRVAAVLVAFGSIAALLRYVGPRLSLSYAERLGALASTTETRRRPGLGRGFGARWLPAELRVVATLIRGQFRHDMNFRLGVLSILPITILYVWMSLRDGRLSDPFVDLGYQADGLGMIHFAVLGMPLVLMEQLFRSESFRASWVFFSVPVDHAKLVSNAGNFVTIFFLVPYLTTVAAIFAWTFGNILHAVGHALVLGLLAHLGIQMLLLVRPRIPFSEPPRKGARMGALLGVVLLGFLIAGLLPLLFWVAYARTEWTIAAVVLLAGAGALMPRLVTRRIRTRVGNLEFTG